MRHLLPLPVLLLSVLAVPAGAQEHYTEGPVWRVVLLDVHPGKFNEYMSYLRQNSRAIWEEMKKQGLIEEYRVHLNFTQDGPNDWDVALAFKVKNLGAVDGFTARADPISLKHFGSKEKRQEAATKVSDLVTTVASRVMREINLK
jgi:hypothetical protein